MDKKLLTVNDVAEILYCSAGCVYKMIKTTDLPKVKIGHKYLIPADELDRWIHRESTKGFKGGK